MCFANCFCSLFMSPTILFCERFYGYFRKRASKHLEIKRPMSPMYLSFKGYVRHTFSSCSLEGSHRPPRHVPPKVETCTRVPTTSHRMVFAFYPTNGHFRTLRFLQEGKGIILMEVLERFALLYEVTTPRSAMLGHPRNSIDSCSWQDSRCFMKSCRNSL
jgi:hypothetical protein